MELQTGDVLGNYRIVRLLGRGGMGVVYEVEHVELGVHYALKVFAYDPADEYAELLKNKFLEEGKILARIKHPNIVRCFDLSVDRIRGILYFVMDLVLYKDGGSWSLEEVEIKNLDEEIVYWWFRDVCSALDCIHEHNIVHRDVKPQNLLVNTDKHIVLTDFGISHIFGGQVEVEVRPDKTVLIRHRERPEKVVLGTDHYMAPEVATGEDPTPAADVYAVGILFFRLFTGKWADGLSSAQVDAFLHGYKYRWYKVIPQLLEYDPAWRPKKLLETIKLLDRPAPEAKGSSTESPAAKKPKPSAHPKPRQVDLPWWRRVNWGRAVFGLAFFLALAWTGYRYGYRGYREWQRQKAELEQRQKAIWMEEQRQAAQSKKKVEPPTPQKIVVTNTIVKVQEKIVEREVAKPADEPPPQEKPEAWDSGEEAGFEAADSGAVSKKSFVETGMLSKKVDYGRIPDQTYLAFQNTNSTEQVKFELGNGAFIDWMPLQAGVFFMRTPDQGVFANGKSCHKVTFTRGFWMSRTAITVDQWRDFVSEEGAEIRKIEQALKGAAEFSVRLNHWQINQYCRFLTEKYRKQLPPGYVVRLPTEAEVHYAFDQERTRGKYHRPHEKGWNQFVATDGKEARRTFCNLKRKYRLDEYGKWDINGVLQEQGGRYRLCALEQPSIHGVHDLWQLTPTLDRLRCFGPGHSRHYADEEVDPLAWIEVADESKRDQCCIVGVRIWREPLQRSWNETHWFHLVVGPDLVAEKTYETCCQSAKKARSVPKNLHFPSPGTVKKKLPTEKAESIKLANGQKMVFCTIPKGKFNMSNIDGQTARTHEVEISYPFWITKYCVTMAQWRDFAEYDHEGKDRQIEEAFAKNRGLMVCPSHDYYEWSKYGQFLTERYGHLLPKGYVFRLPTEAEWEWASVADSKLTAYDLAEGNLRRSFYVGDGVRADKFNKLLGKKNFSPSFDSNRDGFIEGNFIGGRTEPNKLGVCDFFIGGLWTLDTYNVPLDGPPGDEGYWWNGNPARDCLYAPSMRDPIRFDGIFVRRACKRVYERHRCVSPMTYRLQAHLVAAPEIKAVRAAWEMTPYPEEDFGGHYLGDRAVVDEIKSPNGYWCTEQRKRSLLSRENIYRQQYEFGEEMRGFECNSDNDPFIVVKLDESHILTGLMIETLSFVHRTRNLMVHLSEDGEHYVLAYESPHLMFGHRIDLQSNPVKARYIRVSRKTGTNNYFSFHKLLIYGK